MQEQGFPCQPYRGGGWGETWPDKLIQLYCKATLKISCKHNSPSISFTAWGTKESPLASSLSSFRLCCFLSDHTLGNISFPSFLLSFHMKSKFLFGELSSYYPIMSLLWPSELDCKNPDNSKEKNSTKNFKPLLPLVISQIFAAHILFLFLFMEILKKLGYKPEELKVLISEIVSWLIFISPSTNYNLFAPFNFCLLSKASTGEWQLLAVKPRGIFWATRLGSSTDSKCCHLEDSYTFRQHQCGKGRDFTECKLSFWDWSKTQICRDKIV